MSDEPTTTSDVGEQWIAKATDGIESVVGLVRDHSLRPALTVLRFVLVGLLAAALATLMAVLGVVGVVRLLTVDAFSGRVWASDVVVGGGLTVIGLVLLGMSGRVGRERPGD